MTFIYPGKNINEIKNHSYKSFLGKRQQGKQWTLQLDKQKNNYTIYLHKTPTPAMTS